jgi:hypothetical protein
MNSNMILEMYGQITLSATLDIKSNAIDESLGTRGALEQGRKHSIKEEQYGRVQVKKHVHYLSLNKLLVLHDEYKVCETVVLRSKLKNIMTNQKVYLLKKHFTFYGRDVL